MNLAPSKTGPAKGPAILCFIFFLSGASALIFEALWFQLAGLTFGNSIWATSIVLASFMGGLALGNILATVKGGAIRSPVRFYAILEAIIGICGVGLVFLFPHLTAIFAPLFRPFLDQPLVLNFLRSVIAILLMLVPATAMGMTLPVLVKTLSAQQSAFGSVLGRLYGWNTFGATAGVLICELLLVKWLGIRGSGLVAGGCNALAAVTALWLSRQMTIPETAPVIPDRPVVFSKLSIATCRLLAAGFLSGFILLALEVIWFRFMILFFNPHAWNFTVMLAVVLAGISLGGLVAARRFRLVPSSHAFLMPALFFNGMLLAVLYRYFGSFVELLTGYFNQDLRLVIVAIFLMFPVSLMSGMIFTMLGQAIHLEIKSETETAGLLTLANTTGGMLGSLLAGLILIPLLGIEKSFFLLAAAYGVAALMVLDKAQSAQRRVPRYAAGVAFAVALGVFPFGLMNGRYLDVSVPLDKRKNNERRVATIEGMTETIQYFQKDLLGRPYYHRLQTNNHSMSATDISAKRYMKLFVYWPMALHPKVGKALLICFGCGSTAKALTDTRTLQKIDIVDISRDIIKTSKIIFTDPRENPINDPRVRIHIEDGRFFLLSTKEKYDLITAEPPPLVLSGVVNLYTQEYFQLLHDRLAEGGIVTYWLPVYQLKVAETKSILKGFSNVFKNCSVWTGSGFEWMMVGVKNPGPSVSEEAFSRQWKDPKIGREMRCLGFENPEQFGSLFIADGPRLRDWISGSLPLVDNFPRRLSYQNRQVRDLLPAYRHFMNDVVSRINFTKSGFISACWPESPRRQAEKYFAVRQTINEILVDESMRNSHTLENLHACLHNPLLGNYVGWVLGSDHFAQAIVAAESVNPFQNTADARVGCEHLAAGAAARRDFRLAEKYFGQAAGIKDDNTGYQLYYSVCRMYFLLLSGDQKGATRVADEYINLQKEGREQRIKKMAVFLSWMRDKSLLTE